MNKRLLTFDVDKTESVSIHDDVYIESFGDYYDGFIYDENDESKPRNPIGQFAILEYNNILASYFDVKIPDIIDGNIDILKEFHEYYTSNYDKIKEKYERVYLVYPLILKEEYKKHNITQEFVNYIFKSHYSINNLILFLVSPIQSNKENYNIIKDYGEVEIIENLDSEKTKWVKTVDYYEMEKLKNKYDDMEYSTYKLYSLANKCGLKRIDNTNLFFLSEKSIIEKISENLQKNK